MHLHIFAWLVVMEVLSLQFNFMKFESFDGKVKRRWRVFPAVMAFFPIFWLACMGTPVNDVPVYLNSFRNFPSTIAGAAYYLGSVKSGIGFYVIEFLIKIISDNETFFRIIIALIHSIPVVLIFRKFSDKYLLSLYIFAASGCHTAWMMNGLRQFVAVTIILAAFPLLVKKKYVSSIFVVLLACTVHTSAIIMLPTIFIVQGEVWNRKTLFFIILAVGAMFVFSQDAGLADVLLNGTEYSGAITAMREAGDDGVNPLRVLVSAVPAFLAFFSRSRIKEEHDLVLNICCNMSIITVGINIVAMVTSGILVGRLAIYTSLYGFIALPQLLTHAFAKNSQKAALLMLLGFYFIYYCVGMS